MNDNPIVAEAVKRAILGTIANELDSIIEEECAKAQQQVVQRIRAKTGEIVAMVSSWYEFRQRENEVCITVKFEGTQKEEK